MSAKKRKGRVRQTRTDFQKAFDPYQGMIQHFSWSDRLPEVLHISMALLDFDFDTVKTDFKIIADYVNDKVKCNRRFHFNLSHTIELIKKDSTLLDEIFKSCFKSAFEQLLSFYSELFDFKINFEFKPDGRILILGYKNILNGRSDISILCKYIMIQYDQNGNEDSFGLFNWQTTEEILLPMNVSRVMSMFPPSIGQSENFDLDFCEYIWSYNYVKSPLKPKPDESNIEEGHFAEMHIGELTEEFKELYSDFKKINMLSVFHPFIAEVNMGFVARISNLTLDVVDLVKQHKGEIAELTFRTMLETFIVANWLVKRQDISLHKRFRDFSTGRDKFFGQKILEQTDDEAVKEGAKKMISEAIKEAGVRDIGVATERGDIFELRIDQMAEEVWGKDNQYYFLYKRSSGVTHGQWRVIAKYHLAKSYNPMHNGLYWYNENPNKFAGLNPAFGCLPMAVNFLITMLNSFETDEHDELKNKLSDLEDRIWKQYKMYIDKYVFPKKLKAE